MILLLALAITAVAGCFQEGLSAVQERGQGGEVCNRSFHGPISRKAVTYNIYLPPGYYESHHDYPAIYHLHGAGGDHTSLNELIVESLKQAVDAGIVSEMILVFPNGLGLEVDYVQTECGHEAGCLMEQSSLQNFEFIRKNSGLSISENE